MSSYADTSFLVSLYGKDVNSRKAALLARQHHPVFVVTPFGETEFTCIVFAICSRPNTWTVGEGRLIARNFAADLQTGVCQWEDFPSEVWTRARELAGRYGPTLGCRAMDLIHVACALCLGANDFFTFDQDQARLARAAGLRVLGA